MKDYEFNGFIVQNSKKEHLCDGCLGEFPIPKDTWYYKKVSKRNGMFHVVSLCQRCYFAMQNKLKTHDGEWEMKSKGDLKWDKLPSAFKREWIDKFTEGYERINTLQSQRLSEIDYNELKRTGKPIWLRGGK